MMYSLEALDPDVTLFNAVVNSVNAETARLQRPADDAAHHASHHTPDNTAHHASDNSPDHASHHTADDASHGHSVGAEHDVRDRCAGDLQRRHLQVHPGPHLPDRLGATERPRTLGPGLITYRPLIGAS